MGPFLARVDHPPMKYRPTWRCLSAASFVSARVSAGQRPLLYSCSYFSNLSTGQDIDWIDRLYFGSANGLPHARQAVSSASSVGTDFFPVPAAVGPAPLTSPGLS